MSTEVATFITPSLHPDNVKQIEGAERPEIAAVLGPTETAFSEAYEAIRATFVARQAAAKNPTWNEAQQIIATDDFAQKQLARISKRFDTVRGDLERGIAHIEKELSAPVESRASVTLAGKVRAHVKGLGTGERMSVVRKAIEDGDHVVATAILGAPAMLSGMDAKMQAVLLRAYHEKHNPAQTDRLKAMQAAKGLIEAHAGKVFGELERAVGAPPHKARALREAKTNAEKAFVLASN